MKKIFVCLAMMAMTVTAFAEDTVVTVKNEKEYVAPKGAWFISLMGGINHSTNDYKAFDQFKNNIYGLVTFEMGYRFNPYLSLAFEAQYDAISRGDRYSTGINVIEPSFQLYWNLLNTFGQCKADRKNNLYLYAGPAAAMSIIYKEKNLLGENSDNHMFSYGAKMGLQYELMFCRSWAFLADLSWNMFSDKFDTFDNDDSWDGHMNLQVGLRKYFGLNRKTSKYYSSESYTNYITRRDTTVVKKVVEMPQTLPTYSCFFTINKIDLNDASNAAIKECASYLKSNPDKKVTVFGYADKNTGTKKRNAWLASNRARVVKEALIAEGVSSDRVSCYDEGDMVQPFPESVFEKNRSAIMLISE